MLLLLLRPTAFSSGRGELWSPLKVATAAVVYAGIGRNGDGCAVCGICPAGVLHATRSTALQSALFVPVVVLCLTAVRYALFMLVGAQPSIRGVSQA